MSRKKANYNIVSCTRIPGQNRYVCFTRDYRTIVLDRFVRSRVPPPKPPERFCRYPDIFADMTSPDRFAKAVGVPCRLTVPCIVFRYVDGEEVIEPNVDSDMCRDLITLLFPPENTQAVSTWEMIVDLMNYPKHHSTFRQKVYRQAVFIGKKKAYVAPWSPTTPIYYTMKALIELGILDKKFEYEILTKYEAFTIHDVVSWERFGKIKHVAYNFYEIPKDDNKEYEAVAIFWTTTDKAAQRYALRLWDLHQNFTLKIADIVGKVSDYTRTQIEEYIKLAAVGTTHAQEYWHTRGMPASEIAKYVGIDIKREAGMKVEDPTPALSFIMDVFLGLYKPEEEEDEQK